MMRQFDDADQAVSWAAVLMFIRAAFDAPIVLRALVDGPEAFVSPIFLLVLGLLAGKIAAGAGLLKSKRWAWPLAVVVVGFETLLTLLSLAGGALTALFNLFFDALVLYLLFRPAVRERFGIGQR